MTFVFTLSILGFIITAMGKASRKKEQEAQKASSQETRSPGHQIPVYRRRILYERFSWIALIGIVLLTLTAYSSAIGGGFIWDDDLWVTRNPLLTAPHGLWQIWTTTKSPQYYPLVLTTFWVEMRLWGLEPFGYHAVNVSLHVINAILVWLLLRWLEIPGAWMIGAIFAVHPVHVESVAWITERKNVMSGLFYLLSIGCYFQFESRRRWAWYAGALGLFVLALLSKTVVATLPIALLLIRYLKGWRIGRRQVLELVPFLVMGAAMGQLTRWYEFHMVGAGGQDWSLSMGESLLVAGRALAFYVMKLLVPINLSFNYSRWQLDVGDPAQWSWVLGVVAVGLLSWWKRSAWGREPFVGLAFFSVTLAPALGFFYVYPMRFSFVADHFQYLASIGIISLIIGSAVWKFDRWIKSGPHGKGHILERMKPIPGLLVLVILAALTWKHGLIYRDLETLWQDTLNKNPNSWLAHSNLGTMYSAQGRLEEAFQEYQIALKLKPDHNKEAHNNLGNVYSRQGRLEEAIQEYLTALKVWPDYMEAHYNLANAYSSQGRLEEAIQEYWAVLKLQPDNIFAHNHLGDSYLSQGRLEEAIQEYLAVLKLQPDDINAHHNLGEAYFRQGRFEEAIQEYLAVLKLQPDDINAHNYLGDAYFKQGRFEEAIQEFLAVLRVQPDNTFAHNTLGNTYFSQGRLEEAIQEFLAVLRVQPDDIYAHNNLGNAYSRQGRFKKAIPEYLAVLKLQPDDINAHHNLGNVYKLQGLKDEARKQFETVLKLKPDFIPAQRALESLTSR